MPHGKRSSPLTPGLQIDQSVWLNNSFLKPYDKSVDGQQIHPLWKSHLLFKFIFADVVDVMMIKYTLSTSIRIR